MIKDIFNLWNKRFALKTFRQVISLTFSLTYPTTAVWAGTEWPVLHAEAPWLSGSERSRALSPTDLLPEPERQSDKQQLQTHRAENRKHRAGLSRRLLSPHPVRETERATKKVGYTHRNTRAERSDSHEKTVDTSVIADVTVDLYLTSHM